LIEDLRDYYEQFENLKSHLNVVDALDVPVKFSLSQRFALLAAHDRRHLRQAWEIRRHPNFPA